MPRIEAPGIAEERDKHWRDLNAEARNLFDLDVYRAARKAADEQAQAKARRQQELADQYRKGNYSVKPK